MSYNFRRRYTPETIELVFQWILKEAGTAGALTPAAVFIDGTHIKASANLKKKMKLHNKMLFSVFSFIGNVLKIRKKRTPGTSGKMVPGGIFSHCFVWDIANSGSFPLT